MICKLCFEIAKEAIGWDPTIVSSGNSKKFDWLCSLGHKYTAMVVTIGQAALVIVITALATEY
jgi:hypothetical protein